jgi:DNA-binding response OmpR family regulator
MPKKALIIEDEENISELLSLYLERDGFECAICADGKEGYDRAESEYFDVIVLDIMLPSLDGVQVLKRLREENNRVPVIMLTAKGETYDKVFALENGADDYITKPFVPKEVIARIHAVLRRAETFETSIAPDKKVLIFDNLIVNLNAYELVINGQHVDAPPKEIELIYHLASSPNRVFTRNQLLDEVWGFDYFGDSRTVDVHVKRLREKLENVSPKWSVKTVWGIGYKFEYREDAGKKD